MSIERLRARIAWLEAAVQQRAGEAVMANDRVEALEAALHDAFMAMCSHRDNPDDEVFQDAIDALGLAALDKDAGK